MNPDQVLLPYRQDLKPAENLQRILRFIASDGIITVEEVWSLADWINKYPATADCWPGTELVPYLQIIWKDGQLTSQETSGISTLISVIELEFAQQSQITSDDTHDATKDDRRSLSDPLSLLQLPSASHRVQVESSSGDEEYEIDLSGPSCTCPDWVDRRRKHPQRHPGRACKHIIRTLFDVDVVQQASKPLQALLSNCLLRNCGTPPKDEYTIVDLAGQILILSYAGAEWVNVLVPIDDDFERFGYNSDEERWAYGQAPERARIIAEIIHSSWPETKT